MFISPPSPTQGLRVGLDEGCVRGHVRRQAGSDAPLEPGLRRVGVARLRGDETMCPGVPRGGVSLSRTPGPPARGGDRVRARPSKSRPGARRLGA